MADVNPELGAAEGQTGPTLHIGRFRSPAAQSGLKGFFSNLRDFLVERPAKMRPGAPAAFSPSGFGSSIKENWKEFWRPAPKGRVRSDLLVDWNEGVGGFWRNLKDLVAPPKLPPLQTTSQAVDVPEIWSKNPQFTRVQALSVAIHAVVIVLLVVPFLLNMAPPGTTKAQVTLESTSLFLPKLPAGAKRAGGGGGSGQHDPLPATRGKIPKFSLTQLAPPMVHPIEHPQIQVTATIVGNPKLNLPNPNDRNFGDPLGKLLNDSSGSGTGGSIGTGNGTGVGSGNGAGVGPGENYGTGGGMPSAGVNGYGYATCLYCPNPPFTDEAVKEKYQGTVVLVGVVHPDGHVTDIQVVEGLGLGLNEKAIEAVKTWRLKPAIGPDGRPATVRETINIEFRLY